MKLKQEVLQRLNSNKGLGLIMNTLDVSHSSAREYVKNNSDNLTKAAMVKAIEKEYGLSEEQILETETAN
jgi:hypothetical protein